MKKILLSILSLVACNSLFAAEFSQPDAKALPDLFVWTDTCNVWVLRDGDAALLVNLGDGSVLDHLAKIGVKRVEWVLFTDHHREQCQGAPKLGMLLSVLLRPLCGGGARERWTATDLLGGARQTRRLGAHSGG